MISLSLSLSTLFADATDLVAEVTSNQQQKLWSRVYTNGAVGCKPSTLLLLRKLSLT